MKIGIDIDDTITNTYDSIIDFIVKIYSNVTKEEIINRGLTYEYFLTHDKEFPNYKSYNETILNKIVVKASIKDNAKEVIRKLHNMGHKIEIITARNYGEYKDPKEFTKNFLDKNNIYYDNINVNVLNKGDFCKNNNFDLLIDDSIKHCTSCKNNNIKCILIDNAFNKKTNEFIRANNWLEVLKIIQTNKF